MTEPQFDPTGSLRIDLERGTLTLLGSGSRVLLPLEPWLKLLDASAPDSIKAFGFDVGVEVARRILERLGERLELASVELFVEHLGGELALMGLGNLSIERWGHGLVLAIDGLPAHPGLELAMTALFEGVLQRALSRDVAVRRIARESARVRFLCAARETSESIDTWLRDGVSFAEILVRLHAVTAKKGVVS